MNQQLLNPFGQDYPETVDSTYLSVAQRCRFNPQGPYAGSLLALGGVDGSVEVLDMDTKAPIRVFQGHSVPVESIAWSRNNRYLITAAKDMRCIIYDLAYTPQNLPFDPAPESYISRVINFDDPVLHAEFHPRTSRLVLATLMTRGAVLVDLREKKPRVIELRGTTDVDMEAGPSKRPTLCVATFHPSGSFIYAGTTAGVLLTIDVASRTVVDRFETAHCPLKQLAFDRTGRYLVANATDRAVRVLQVDPWANTATHAAKDASAFAEPLHRFQDTINRTSWNAVGFSGDGEYVIGGAGTKESHNIYIWDRAGGTLVKVLEGPKDSLDDCDWSAGRTCIASVTSAGVVNIWQTTVDESWSAFAPGFEELDENREYEEREDEFDIEDEELANKRKQAEEEQDILVLGTRAQFAASFDMEGSFPPGSVDWRAEWPDDDDRPDFFPHLDLEDEVDGGEDGEE